jgi:predicted metal-dependent peptidase
MKTAIERITKQRTQLILSQPFFGTLALRLRTVERHDIQTMAVDGKSLFYNPAFVDTLSDEELRGVIAHEVMHCVHHHMTRRGSRGPLRWNKAADYVINPEIKTAGFTLPADHLDDPQFRGMSTDAIYNRLPEQPQGGGGQGDGDPGGCGEVLDGDAQSEAERGEIEREWKQATITAAEQQAAAKGIGSLPGSIQQIVAELRNPRVDWRASLRRFLEPTHGAEETWSRPNRRFIGAGLILPGREHVEPGPLAVMVDTSGTCIGEPIQIFCNELAGILDEVRPEKTYLAAVDTAVADHREFQADDPLVWDWIKGGGGTAFSCVTPWLNQHAPDAGAMVGFTDGYVHDWPADPGFPVLWAVVGNPNAKPPFGEVIHLDDI